MQKHTQENKKETKVIGNIFTIFPLQNKKRKILTNNKNVEGFVISPIKIKNKKTIHILIGKYNKK